MHSPIQLIVGLANPGKEYADTRHNAGAWLIQELIKETNIHLKFESKFHGLHQIFRLNEKTCHLLIPNTFMNHSGQAVQACMHYLKLTTDAILIAHDEIDLPVGTIRLKFDGGDGGHNGLKDIIRHLNTKKFNRLRIGVGRPKHSKDTIDYVLHPPSKADRKIINQTILQAIDILPLVLEGHLQQAMQKLHTEL